MTWERIKRYGYKQGTQGKYRFHCIVAPGGHSHVLVSELPVRRNSHRANRDRDSPVQQSLIDRLISRPSNKAISFASKVKAYKTYFKNQAKITTITRKCSFTPFNLTTFYSIPPSSKPISSLMPALSSSSSCIR